MPAPTKEATLLTSIQTISIVVGALVVFADSWSAARPQGLCCPQRLEPLSLPAPPRRCAAALGSPISLFRNLACALFPSPWRRTRPKRDSHCACDHRWANRVGA